MLQCGDILSSLDFPGTSKKRELSIFSIEISLLYPYLQMLIRNHNNINSIFCIESKVFNDIRIDRVCEIEYQFCNEDIDFENNTRVEDLINITKEITIGIMKDTVTHLSKKSLIE